jgi:hypothetical protein
MVASKGQRITLTVLAVSASLLLYTGIGARRQIAAWAGEWYAAWRAGNEIRFKVYDVSDLVYLTTPDDRLKMSGSDLLESVDRQLTERKSEAAVLQQRIMVKATAWEHLKIRKLLDALRVARARPESCRYGDLYKEARKPGKDRLAYLPE